MSVPSHNLRDSVSRAMEARALNRFQTLRCFNPDADSDSLSGRIVGLRRYGVPENVVKAMFADVRAILLAGAAEDGCLHELAGQLDDLARIAHRAERTGDSAVRAALTVKALARALGPHLKVIAAPREHDPLAYVRAVRGVDRIVAQVPRAQLNGSLRKELGARRHDLLLSIIDRQAEAIA